MSDRKPGIDAAAPLVEQIAAQLRTMATEGELTPGERLSEARLSADLGVSRNTLRESFRLLTREGLARYEPNRGVFVAIPSMPAIIDIYRVRRLIEIPALAQAWPKHAAVAAMRAAVVAAEAARERGDWRAVGSANMVFHGAVVALIDSPRLTAFFAQVVAELRLAFGLLPDPELLHEPFIAENAAILAAVDRDDAKGAAKLLAGYLDRSEGVVLAAFARLEDRRVTPTPRDAPQRRVRTASRRATGA
ncbi:GntR family transcriptional regulator [Paracoccus spongiarum]|uniref:GntR family transcriptional regulator n=1 Tax=Paracoccus spongiarum TaxID=3064387 RepID=A0ABT9JH91_9RHOB|nr:GntR family transcriptional regulator [Paracoccus sp. 2205BS29-5]MDP5309204.1 GntR family transcriptional regulator [Paracoccus sp. 2205BS29-5]